MAKNDEKIKQMREERARLQKEKDSLDNQNDNLMNDAKFI